MLREVMAMTNANPARSRLFLTGAVALYELIHLAWEYLHGGVATHHLLNRADMPAISNWWGLVVLPGLAWHLIGRMQARETSRSHARIALPIVLRLLAAFVYGAGLSTAFAFGYEAVTSTMFFGMFALAVVLPIYRAEYFLGFVLGMTMVFGAVLPTIVACVFALVSLAIHPVARFIVKAVVQLASRSRQDISAQARKDDSSGVV